MAEIKGLTVQLVPFSDHHPIYSSEDIEIWIVRRNNCAIESSKSSLPFELVSWGESLSEINAKIKGVPVTLHQVVGGGIGGILWPSSAIGSK